MTEGPALQPETCFACGTVNPVGLHVTFQHIDDRAVGQFTGNQFHEGWPGILHGGILTTLMDEAMAYALWYGGIHAVTVRMETRFRKPAGAGQRLYISAAIGSSRGKVIDANSQIENEDGQVVCQAIGRFMRADVNY